MMRNSSAFRRSLTVAAAAALAATFVPAQAHAAPAVPHVGQGAIADPDQALGSKWRSSSDVVVTGAGDADGFHLYIAREKDAYGWQTLATLKSTSIDVGPWGGSVCVTGSGHYAVAVFAPLKASNDPKLMMAGALAAVVDTTTGKATAVAAGVQFSYFNPSCGPGDRALLTRAVGDDDTEAGRSTDLLTVDAAAGKVVRTRHIDAQLTTPAPGPDGDYGIVAGQLVEVSPTGGSVTKLGRPQGRPFALQATSGGGVDVVSADGNTAVAQRFGGGKFTTTATGPRDRVQLFGLTDGRDALVGQVSRSAGLPSDLTTMAEDKQVDTVSGRGHLIVEETLAREAAAAAAQPLTPVDPNQAGQVRFRVRAVAGRKDSAAVVDTAAAPTLDVDVQAFSPVQSVQAAASADAASPCMIPRNDPTIQPLQPSPNQVEWAVDNAVHGTLTASRPANYLKAGLPSYSPQGMFQLDTARNSDGNVSGAGRVPANLELGILAQETNLSQASWHEVPGDTGNPLIASYYGSGDINTINYAKADCGYGIGQVTTGMSSKDDPLDQFTHTQQVAVAVDYEVNIAASVNILIDKWNQLHLEPSGFEDTVNNDNANYIENWFLALWAYNSGLHPYAQRNSTDSGGYFGLGWLNNPANPDYSAGRDGFLRDTLGDASHPGDWSYPERIMGWVETPQNKGGQFSQAYQKPAFGTDPTVFIRLDTSDPGPHFGVTIPGLYDFCDSQFGCSQASNGCPAVNNSCWWHGHVDFADCGAGRCSMENLAYPPGSGSEPDVVRTYPRDCTPFDPSSVAGYDSSVAMNMIYTLNDTSQYNLGCAITGGTLGGKFLLREGSPAGQDGTPYADIDLHQQGVGYLGHSWFTHGASGTALTKHKIVAAWEPDMPLNPGKSKAYTIWAHEPSHGGTWTNAVYNIQLAANNKSLVSSPHIDQGPEASGSLGSDHWVNLGKYTLGRGALVLLSNSGAPDSADVGFDAMAFVPMT